MDVIVDILFAICLRSFLHFFCFITIHCKSSQTYFLLHAWAIHSCFQYKLISGWNIGLLLWYILLWCFGCFLLSLCLHLTRKLLFSYVRTQKKCAKATIWSRYITAHPEGTPGPHANVSVIYSPSCWHLFAVITNKTSSLRKLRT